MSQLDIENVSKRFGDTTILKGVSVSASPGEFLTLLGPSGCGKSTLLRIIAGLEMQDSGCIAIGGRMIDALRPKRRDVAMVFQSYALYPHMTVSENIALPLRMRWHTVWQRIPVFGHFFPGSKAVTRQIEGEVRSVAHSVGIEKQLSRKPGQLSGGQRQRVALARAMVRQPTVFLMDEPLSNLDAKLRMQMRTEIKDMHRRLGATFVYVTHDQTEAMTMADRIAIMFDGEILQIATPAQIYDDPFDRRVAEFIGSPKINMLDGTVRVRGKVHVAGTSISIDAGDVGTHLTLGIRPEAFLSVNDRPGPNTINGRVKFTEHLGSDLYVYLDVDGASDRIVARMPPHRATRIRHGEALHLKFSPNAVLVFDQAGARVRIPTAISANRRSA
ncbi:ABC transporter ATP-binding protein [Mesorhizobium sp. WSM3224]|uniref:ABC transporter ATP-binding protein n=1 Tax=Mesorhizobium sp. WSM3224 TaxID=1040986 RepID=UPI00048953B6|nr:ABC transporter ATP-binding protein [Mesorhizobium sp. WSM3224]